MALGVLSPLVSCGARTPLLVLTDGPDATPIPTVDSGRVAFDSTTPPPDAFDATDEPDIDIDATVDSLPPFDARFVDVVVDNCPDAGATLVYVLTEDNQLFSFYPPTLTFTLIGTLACPTTASPFSMAVDRTGVAYSVFTDGTLFQVDVATAACVPTSFATGQDGFSTFGMGFVADTNDTGETLYVAESGFTNGRGLSMGLASIDTTAFTLGFVGPFNPPIPGPELTGTSSGRLFGFYTNMTGSGSHIVEIDRTTGDLLGDNPLQAGNMGDGYAFAFWGGSFWVFTFGAGGSTQVTQFDPATGTETSVTTMPQGVVGAGVSTCAPQ